MTARIPASALVQLAAALERACREVPLQTPIDGSLWDDLNIARANVRTYLLPSIPQVEVEVSGVP